MKVICIALLALTVTTTLFAQDKVELRANIDLASFRYDAEMSYVEFYYSFSRGALHYTREEGIYSGSLLVHAIIRNADSNDEPVLKSWRVPVMLKDTADLADKMLVGKVNYLLKPGRYRVALVSRDEAFPKKIDSVEVHFVVRDFSKAKGLFSDIELCTNIQRIEPDSSNIFFKNTLEVIPNPTMLFGHTSPRAMYYAELYGAELDSFIIKTEVVNAYGKTMFSQDKDKAGKVASRVEVGAITVAAYPTGQYTLVLSYANSKGAVVASQSKPFYVYNPAIPIDTTSMRRTADLISFQFASLTEEELDDEFSQAQYVATKEERELWNALDGPESKRKFLTKFWSERDTDTSTPLNEAFDQYKQRVLIANDKFRTAFREGWRTDRGRVYVIYGPPDYVDRRASESDMKPHEIWRYDYIEGGVDFYFLDRNGFGNYELVHSTKRGEIYNVDWQRLAQ